MGFMPRAGWTGGRWIGWAISGALVSYGMEDWLVA